MEYALHATEVANLPEDPRLFCCGELRDLLPPAPLRAVYFGSEFCQDLLPTADQAKGFCEWATQAGIEPVLLTPVVTQQGLAAVGRLLREIGAEKWAPSVVVNDWGVLNLVRRSYPGLRRRSGRLMNRALRDPRLLKGELGSSNLPPDETLPPLQGEGRGGDGGYAGTTDLPIPLLSSPLKGEGRCSESSAQISEGDAAKGTSRAETEPGRTAGERGGRLRALLVQLGVEALETDADLDGGFLGEPVGAMQRVLHFPYTFAATGRNCLVKADGAASAEQCFTKGLGRPCAGMCRNRVHPVTRADTGFPLWRSGNTIFYQVPREIAAGQVAAADRIVLYRRPTA